MKPSSSDLLRKFGSRRLIAMACQWYVDGKLSETQAAQFLNSDVETLNYLSEEIEQVHAAVLEALDNGLCVDHLMAAE